MINIIHVPPCTADRGYLSSVEISRLGKTQMQGQDLITGTIGIDIASYLPYVRLLEKPLIIESPEQRCYLTLLNTVGRFWCAAQ